MISIWSYDDQIVIRYDNMIIKSWSADDDMIIKSWSAYDHMIIKSWSDCPPSSAGAEGQSTRLANIISYQRWFNHEWNDHDYHNDNGDDDIGNDDDDNGHD